MTEFDIIREFFQRCADAPDLRVGIGDDGAVLRPRPGFDQVVVTDTLVEGRHFPPEFAPADIGWRVLAVNLSDMAAMGASPRFAFLNLALPRADREWLHGFTEGFFELAQAAGVVLAGGDTTEGPLCISVTLLGEVPQDAALLRSGARAGDRICISGQPGEAMAGLDQLLAGTMPQDRTLIDRFRRPQPRLALGRALTGKASAAIDVSDGLLADLGHMLDASKQGARIDLSQLPVSAALKSHAENAVDYVLAGGDDYELCFCIAPDRLALLRAQDVACDVHDIGEVLAEPGLKVIDVDGNEYHPARQGWEHFSGARE